MYIPSEENTLPLPEAVGVARARRVGRTAALRRKLRKAALKDAPRDTVARDRDLAVVDRRAVAEAVAKRKLSLACADQAHDMRRTVARGTEVVHNRAHVRARGYGHFERKGSRGVGSGRRVGRHLGSVRGGGSALDTRLALGRAALLFSARDLCRSGASCLGSCLGIVRRLARARRVKRMLAASHCTHTPKDLLVLLRHLLVRRAVRMRAARQPLDEAQLVDRHVACLDRSGQRNAFARVLKEALAVHAQRTVQRRDLLHLARKERQLFTQQRFGDVRGRRTAHDRVLAVVRAGRCAE